MNKTFLAVLNAISPRVAIPPSSPRRKQERVLSFPFSPWVGGRGGMATHRLECIDIPDRLLLLQICIFLIY